MTARIYMWVAAMLLTSWSAAAQCKTFSAADEANPLLSALPANTMVAGFDFADIDNDGDLDAYLIAVGGSPVLYLNTGNSTKAVFTQSPVSGFEKAITPAGSPTIQLVDIDGDADFDCFISDVSYDPRASIGVKFYRNTGSAKRPKFVEDAANNPVAFARTSINYMMFMFADIDKDGDLDFYHTGMYNYTFFAYDQATYLNTGTSTSPVYTLYSTEHNHDFKNQRLFHDWNNDGFTDYFRIDTYNSMYDYWKNAGNTNMPVFAMDVANAPVFKNGLPARLVDLNSDGAVEAFTADGHYSTLAPVAAISAKETEAGGRTVVRLFSLNQSPDYEYSWEYNGTIVGGANRPWLFALKPGKYNLYVKNHCGTGVSLAFAVAANKDGLLAVAAQKEAPVAPSSLAGQKAFVYPNPFIGDIRVQLPFSNNPATRTIKVVDLAGHVLLSQTVSGTTVQLGSSLRTGVYFLQVFEGNNRVYYTRILKQ